jgi:hypothetical protein
MTALALPFPLAPARDSLPALKLLPPPAVSRFETELQRFREALETIKARTGPDVLARLRPCTIREAGALPGYKPEVHSISTPSALIVRGDLSGVSLF